MRNVVHGSRQHNARLSYNSAAGLFEKQRTPRTKRVRRPVHSGRRSICVNRKTEKNACDGTRENRKIRTCKPPSVEIVERIQTWKTRKILVASSYNMYDCRTPYPVRYNKRPVFAKTLLRETVSCTRPTRARRNRHVRSRRNVQRSGNRFFLRSLQRTETINKTTTNDLYVRRVRGA